MAEFLTPTNFLGDKFHVNTLDITRNHNYTFISAGHETWLAHLPNSLFLLVSLVWSVNDRIRYIIFPGND